MVTSMQTPPFPEPMANLKRWELQHRAVCDIKVGGVVLVEEPIRALADGEVQVRTLYLSSYLTRSLNSALRFSHDAA